jgi:hydroxymethylglutaryl-CoA reductase
MIWCKRDSWARDKGGFTANSTDPIQIGQIQTVGISDPNGARMEILSAKDEILKKANDQDPVLVKLEAGQRIWK